MKNISVCLLLFFASSILHSQSGLESVLADVLLNNKSLAAYKEFNNAKAMQFKTGLTPADPFVDYDYLFGNNETSGNQVEFSITQSFDFPTVYGKRKDVSESNITLLEIEMVNQRQIVLFDAQTTYLQIVYLNKLGNYYRSRKIALEELVENFQTKLNKGEANILDLNKAKLNLIEINTLYKENISDITQMHQHLTELNGGNMVLVNDTIYPVSAVLPAFEILEQEFELNDPLRKMLEQEKVIAQNELSLRKALWLPKIETGYHYQGILGETFQGFHAGISIPLWQNKNTINAQESYINYTKVQLASHTNEHYYEIKEKYERYLSLAASLEEYRKIFNEVNNKQLLDKALALNQISVIDYFFEMSFFDNASRNYLQTENEYFEIIAELNKYKL